jgi:hypothetical protein
MVDISPGIACAKVTLAAPAEWEFGDSTHQAAVVVIHVAGMMAKAPE